MVQNLQVYKIEDLGGKDKLNTGNHEPKKLVFYKFSIIIIIRSY